VATPAAQTTAREDTSAEPDSRNATGIDETLPNVT
jgi:hypothetical protein